MSTKTVTPAPTPAVREASSQEPTDRPDWGTMNRELLAEQLRADYHASETQAWYYESYVKPRPIEDGWIAVANKAISILLETPSEQ